MSSVAIPRTTSVRLNPARKKITWVVKLSKRCNLRCRYCYEYDDLGSKDRIRLEDVPTLLKKAKDISNIFGAECEFCWHGGEPMLNGAAYLTQLQELHRAEFGKESSSIVQTNLTVLDEAGIEVLKRFTNVSISMDVAGGARVSQSGRDIQAVVLKNMARLVNQGISFGSISVLTQANRQDLETIFEFYNRAGISFRILPFYRAASQEQADAFQLSPDEVAEAMREVIDLWLSQGNGISISPLDSFRAIAMRYVYDVRDGTRFDKRTFEPVFVVDTDGSIYDVAETYDVEHCYGNIFSDSPQQIIDSAGRQLSLRESEERMDRYCTGCTYHSYCSGWWASAATIFERTEKVGSCVVPKRSIDRCVEWLRVHQANVS